MTMEIIRGYATGTGSTSKEVAAEQNREYFKSNMFPT